MSDLNLGLIVCTEDGLITYIRPDHWWEGVAVEKTKVVARANASQDATKKIVLARIKSPVERDALVADLTKAIFGPQTRFSIPLWVSSWANKEAAVSE